MLFEEGPWFDSNEGENLKNSLFADEPNLEVTTIKRGKRKKKNSSQQHSEKVTRLDISRTFENTMKQGAGGVSPKIKRRKKVVQENKGKSLCLDTLDQSDLGRKSDMLAFSSAQAAIVNTESKRENDADTVKPTTGSSGTNRKSHRGLKKNRLAKMLAEEGYRMPTKFANGKSSKFQTKENLISSSPTTPLTTPASRSDALSQTVKNKLQSAQFRFINEQLYTRDSKDAKALFSANRKSFETYHNGFNQQVSKWPVNPLDLIINFIKKRPAKWVIGDFGCGDARLARSVKNKVHSFDLVAMNDKVTVADISHVPLGGETLDVAVFCLSLMGINYLDFLVEANRTLKPKGLLLIAEVASRLKAVPKFVSLMKKLGFELKLQDRKNSHFLLFDFVKTKPPLPDVKDPVGLLKPCVYKKR